MSKGGLSPTSNKNSLKKSNYQQLDDKGIRVDNLDYIKIIEQKDQEIRKLQFKVQKLSKQKEELLHGGTAEVNAINFYKQKLQAQINQNDRALQLFLNLSHRMLKLIQLFKITTDLSQDCTQVKNFIKMIDDGNHSLSKIESSQYSEFQNIEDVQVQINKRIDDLQAVCDVYHKTFTKIQKQNMGMQKRIKQLKGQYEQQSKTLNKQLKQARTAKQQLKKLLEKNQQQRKQLVASIANSLDPKFRKQLQKMGRQQLIESIKKLGYKINELQTAKTEIAKENKKIKMQDLEKYKKMLTEVKEVRDISMMRRTQGY